jgi:leucine dehydrogenase
MLAEAGANLVIADVDADRTRRVSRDLDARITDVTDIARCKADIFAPCALGGVLTHKTAATMTSRLICGAANNQLAHQSVADRLQERGIVYIPDYVANAGGIISAASEYLEESGKRVAIRVAHIGLRTAIILEEAARTRRSPATVADEIAAGILAGLEPPAGI